MNLSPEVVLSNNQEIQQTLFNFDEGSIQVKKKDCKLAGLSKTDLYLSEKKAGQEITKNCAYMYSKPQVAQGHYVR